MLWQPINLTERCPPHASFTACSPFGFLYLSILVELFGGAEDKRIQTRLKEQEHLEEKYRHFAGIEGSLQTYGGNLAGLEGSLQGFGSGEEEYDFIVVGAGAAGCVVASRLTEYEQFNVLLLEAGPEQPDITKSPSLAAGLMWSNIMWMYQTYPNGKSCLGYQGQSCLWAAGRTMGGGSSVNSMTYVRGNKLDYDNWAAMGNEGWSYKDVLPYFKKFEKNLNLENQNRKYHGVNGPVTIARYPFIDIPSIMYTEAFHQSGLPILDFNAAQQLGTNQAQAFSQDGVRMSTNNAYIQPIRYKRKNLTVKVNSMVVEILFNGNRACGVKYMRNGHTYTATARKEVIISAGPIRSPMILMQSGIGPHDHLQELGIPVKKDLAVGFNLMDHPTFDGILIVLPNEIATTVNDKAVIDSLFRYKTMKIKEGPISGNGPVNSAAFIKTDPNLPAPDIEIQSDSVQSWREYAKDPIQYMSVPIFPTAFYDGMIPRAMLITPKSRGRIYLNATDIYGNPIIDINYFGDDRDLPALIKGFRYVLSLENSVAFKERGAYFYKKPLPPCEGYVWGSDEYLACMARTHTSSAFHVAGTCKMGPGRDKTAVVDPRLRVHGVEGLRVIDSSIMPVVTRGNTNAPTIMIGEKGAALVLEDWLPKYVTLH